MLFRFGDFMKKLSLFAFGFVLFGTQAFAAETTYTMEEAVKKALLDNRSIISAQKSAEASKSALYSARGAFGPSVTASYAVSHDPYSDFQKSLLQGKDLDETTYTFGVEVRQPLFQGFQLLNNAQKAKLQSEYDELQLKKTNIAVANQVQTAFLQFLMAEESVQSAEKAVRRADEQRAIATEGYQIGVRPKIDVLQAEYELSSSEARLIENENNLNSVRAQLNSFLNLPVEKDVDYVGRLDSVPFMITFEEAVKKAFVQLPDVKMAEKSMNMAEKDMGIALGTFLPRIDGIIQYMSTGRNGMTDEDLRSHGYDPSLYVTSPLENTTIGLQATMNVFNSGQDFFKVRQAKHGVDALKAQVELAYNNAALNVKVSLLKLQDAARTVDVSTRALDSARQSYDDAKTRYEYQIGTNLEMLTAQSDLADAELAYISSKANYLISLSNLYAALGEINASLNTK